MSKSDVRQARVDRTARELLALADEDTAAAEASPRDRFGAWTVLAAVVPARRASRIDVLQALTHG